MAADRLGSTVIARNTEDGNGVAVQTNLWKKVDGNAKETTSTGSSVTNVGGMFTAVELADVAVTTRRVVGRGGGQGDHGESDEGSDDDTGEHSELILKNLGI